MHPADRTYRNQVVRLADLTVINDIITGVTFENCEIVGPAIIALLGKTSLEHSGIDGDTESVLWDVGDREHVIGAIGLMDCTVVGCRLQRIGFAVPTQDRQKFLEGFGFGS